MELIWLKLVWQTGKLLQQCGKQNPVWRCMLCYFEGERHTLPLKTPSIVFIFAVPGSLNNFSPNHSLFAVNHFDISPSRFIIQLFHPRNCSLCDKHVCVCPQVLNQSWCCHLYCSLWLFKMCNCWNVSCNSVFQVLWKSTLWACALCLPVQRALPLHGPWV